MSDRNCLVCGRSIGNKDVLMSFNNMPGSAQDIPTKDDLKSDKCFL